MKRDRMAEPVTIADGGRLSDIAPEIGALTAGVAGLAAWELVARVVAPFMIGQTLDPSGLIQMAIGIENTTLAMILHIATAVVVFPAGYVVVLRIIRGVGWPIIALIYGVVLWVVAMVVVVHYLAGMPAFLDWAPVAWMSLIGHIALALAMGGYVAWSRRSQPAAP